MSLARAYRRSILGKAGKGPGSGRSLLRHAGLAQAGKVSGVQQGLDVGRHGAISARKGLNLGDAGIPTATQSAGFGEFGGGALGVAFEAIGRGEKVVRPRQFLSGAARLFEPQDCLVNPRLQKMYEPDLAIKVADSGIEGTEADGLFLKRDYFLY